MDAELTARDFLAAFYRGDRVAARLLLDEDFDFTGPFVQTRGAERFLDAAGPLLAASAGHTVVRSWSDGDDVCLVHDVTLRGTVEPVTMADWLTVRGGRVVAERVVLDTARLQAALQTVDGPNQPAAAALDANGSG